ncbi:MAG: hypothetical protein ABGZ17_29300, partial [Planctomycetaceae bacterium]
HDRHATLDRDARYATLQKSNLRAERDELAILREQLQMASGNVPAKLNQTMAQVGSDEQQQLAAEWTLLRTNQDDLQHGHEDIERQRREIDRHWIELESQIMNTHGRSETGASHPSPDTPFAADDDSDKFGTLPADECSSDFGDDGHHNPRCADDDHSTPGFDDVPSDTEQLQTEISLTALFGTAAALPQSPDVDLSGFDAPPLESPPENEMCPPAGDIESTPPLDNQGAEREPEVEIADDAPAMSSIDSASSRLSGTDTNIQPCDESVRIPTSEELQEESIEVYMERLLSQSRSMTQSARRQTTQKPAVEQPKSEEPRPNTEPDQTPKPHKQSTAANTQLSNTPVHMQDRDEVRAGLNSLRELANYSARSAIVSHTWRKYRTSILTKMSLVFLAFAMMVGLSLFRILPYTQNLITRCALSAIVVAALYALLNPVQSLHILRRDRNRSFPEGEP